MSAEVKRIANQIATTCGVSKTLVVAHDDAVFNEIRLLGVNAFLLDVSVWNTLAWEEHEDFRTLSLFADDQFDCVVVVGILESVPDSGTHRWIAELRRISAHYLYVVIDTCSQHAIAGGGRVYWEVTLFAAGFRRHPAYYRVNNYERLNNEGTRLSIPLEKVPPLVSGDDTLDMPRGDCGSYVDVLREVGEEADACAIRYQWAAEYVRPGDRVLDVACGMGGGSYVLKHLSEARSVFGVDGSEYAVDYARKSFGTVNTALSFAVGQLPGALGEHADGCFDVIVVFDILAADADTTVLLGEFARLLSPGGRLITSVRGNRNGEEGGLLDPSRRYIDGWTVFKTQLKAPLLLEQVFAQTVSTDGIVGADNAGRRVVRSLTQVDEAAVASTGCGWLLAVAMKSPLCGAVPYRESVYGYSEPPRHLMAFARDYRNPWLVRALVEFPFRAKSSQLLCIFAEQVLADPVNTGWPDEAAALAVLGYQQLSTCDEAGVSSLLARIDAYLMLPITSPHGLRWHVSLSYLRAQFHWRFGRLQLAFDMLQRVANMDCATFSPTIGTKVVDAAYEGGMIRASLADISGAREMWRIGVRQAFTLLRAPIEEFIGTIEFPQTFPGAVMVELLDSAVRSLRALRWTSEQSSGESIRLLEMSRQNWKWMIRERSEALAISESMVRDRDAAIDSMGGMIRERDMALAAQANLIQARDEALAAQAALIQARDAALLAQAAVLDDRASAINNMERMIVDRDSVIVANTTMIQDRDATISHITTLLAGHERVIDDMKNTATKREVALDDQQRELMRLASYVAALEALQDSLPVKFLRKLGIVSAIRKLPD